MQLYIKLYKKSNTHLKLHFCAIMSHLVSHLRIAWHRSMIRKHPWNGVGGIGEAPPHRYALTYCADLQSRLLLSSNKFSSLFQLRWMVSWAALNGGEGGIRTPGTLSGTTDFESVTFGHSATSPYGGQESRVCGLWQALTIGQSYNPPKI